MVLAFKEKDGTVNMLVSGKVTQEPQLTAKENKVRFSVAYGKSKYMNCEARNDADAGYVAGCLEKGDHVTVLGVWEQWEYNDKTYETLRADFVIPQGAMLPGGQDDSRYVGDASIPAYIAPKSNGAAPTNTQTSVNSASRCLAEIEDDEDDGDLPF